MLAVTVMATGTACPGSCVYATEEGTYTQEQENLLDTDIFASETEESTETVKSEDENQEEMLTEEAQIQTEEFLAETVENISDAPEEETEVKLIDQHLRQKVDDCQVTVSGKMPEGAKLCVKTKEIAEVQKREISEKSDIVKSVQDLEREDIFACFYDISITYQNKTYEPYLFDEKVTVSIKVADAEEAEILPLSEMYGKQIEKFDVAVEADKVSFTTDRFGKYILITETTYAKQTTWDFSHTGETEILEIPSTGIYEIKLYGAQGEHSDSYEGGKGGFVSSRLSLQKKDVLTIQTAGQNGYPDAGNGEKTHGGGATRLYVNGTLVAVAGGGGGALTNRDGGAGGTTLGKVSQPQGESSDTVHSAGGGAGYEGGKAGYVIYHEHTGEAQEKGGCYTKEVYHSHTQSCYGVICAHDELKYLGAFRDETGDDYSDWKCKKCGKIFVSNTTYGEPGTHPTYGWICRKEGVVEKYDLGCGMTTETIVDSQQAYGGSNYLSQICEEGISQSGMKEGDGMAKVSLVELDCATLYYENDGKEFKTYHIERGTEFSEIFEEMPQKPEDERYRYTFLGWDNLSTTVVETMTKEETIKGVMNGNRNYVAVYKKNPQTYQVHFENDEKVPHGTTSILATYQSKMENIIVPQKEGYIFAGYYADVTDEATKYFDAYGIPVRYADFTKESVLTAKWEDPLNIIKNPQNQTITTGYSGVVLTMEAALKPSNGYQLSYQWYVNDRKEIAGAKEIETGFTDKLLVPQDYPVGEYYFFAKATVTGSVEQKIDKYTQIATLQVTKGILDAERLRVAEREVVYDGKTHELRAIVEKEPNAVIYYAQEPLTAKNYQTAGKKQPYSYKNAGEYSAYVYVVSENYDDFADVITMKIEKAKPEIYLASKNTTYRENKVQSISNAVVYGVNKEILADASVRYTYYTDRDQKQKTGKKQGAETAGGAPSSIGTYYVSAKVEESKNYQAAETVQGAMLNILGTHVPYTVGDYVGIYDGAAHGICVSVEDKERVTFYYATDTALTEDTYKTQGSDKQVTFTDAGEYTVYYAVANKLTNELFSVDTGAAKVIIKKAVRKLGTQYPTVNPDKTLKIPDNTIWEYKKQDGKTKEWTLYQENEKLADGIYDLRIPEDKNYEASESIQVQVGTKSGNGNSNAGSGENTSSGDSTTEENTGSSSSTGKKEEVINTDKKQEEGQIAVVQPEYEKPVEKEKNKVENTEFGKWRPKKIPSTAKTKLSDKKEETLKTIEAQPVAATDYVETIPFSKIEKETDRQTDEVEKANDAVRQRLILCTLSGFFAGILVLGVFLIFFLLWKKKRKNEEEEISNEEKMC